MNEINHIEDLILMKLIFNKLLLRHFPPVSLHAVDGPPFRLFFRVKFYSSEPNNLREEFTR